MTTDSPNDFDLVVLGSGTGGYSAAFRAGQLGLRTALVEHDVIGGTCLNWGCIPTKVMLESADLLARVKDSEKFGIRIAEHAVDYAIIAKRRREIIDRLVRGLMTLIPKNRVEWVHGHGVLENPGTVRVDMLAEDGTPSGEVRLLRTKNIIVATGSRVASSPGIEIDGERIVSSDDVLRSTTLPRSIIVIGAGATGVEFASFFRDVGCEVTMLARRTVTPHEDKEVSRVVNRALSRRGMKIIEKARFDPASVVADESGVRMVVGPEGGERTEIRADQLLVATGRDTNIEDIGLEKTRVVVEKGLVMVDQNMETAEPHVYAIGDIIGGLWLAHVAAHEGFRAVHTIAGEHSEPVDYMKMPRGIYSRPQVATIGWSEEELQRDGVAYKVGRFPFLANGKALIEGDPDGFVKVLADTNSDAILGVHMVGPHVTDLIAEASAVMYLEGTATEMGSACHPHPTLCEIVGEAALAVAGRQINA